MTRKEAYSRIYLYFALAAVYISFQGCNSSSRCNRSGEAVFKKEPEDVIIREGEDAVFTCIVSDFNPEMESVSWRVDPDVYISSTTRSLDKVTKDLTSTLIIHNFGKIEQSVQCILQVLDPILFLQTCFSDTVHLRAKEFPTTQDLACTPAMPTEVREGDIFPIRCEVLAGSSPIELHWFVPQLNMTLPQSHNDTDLLILKYDLHIDRSMHNKSFICSVRSSISPSAFALSCTIGPFLVHHPPVTKIYPTHVTLSLESNRAMVQCEVEGYPEDFIIDWECFPTYIFNSCSGEGANIIRISLSSYAKDIPIANFPNVWVMCKSRNSAGNSSVISRLTITDFNMPNDNATTNSPDECLNNTPLIHLNSNHSFDPISATEAMSFLCFFDSPLPIECIIHFKWYVDGTHISSSVIKVTILTVSQNISMLTLKNLTKDDDGTNVECEVNIADVRLSVNITLSNHARLTNGSMKNRGDKDVNDVTTASVDSTTSVDALYNYIAYEKTGQTKVPQDIDQRNGRHMSEGKLIIVIVLSVATSSFIMVCLFTGITIAIYRYFNDAKSTGRMAIGNAKCSTPNFDMLAHLDGELHCASAVKDDPLYEEPHEIAYKFTVRQSSLCPQYDTKYLQTRSPQSSVRSFAMRSNVSSDAFPPDNSSEEHDYFAPEECNIYANQSIIDMKVNTNDNIKKLRRSQVLRRDDTPEKNFPTQPPLPPFPVQN